MTTATIASGQTTSAAIDVSDYTLLAITGPAALTGANIAILGCDTADGTFLPVVDIAGTALAFTAATVIDQWVIIPPATSVSVRYIKLQSDGTEGATRTFGIIVKDVI